MKNSLYRSYAVLYNFSYMAIGALTPLIAQYLKYAGFTGSQIGTITAAGTTVAVFASVFWGGIYNGAFAKHRVIMFIMLMAAACSMILPNISGYVMTLAVFGTMYFFQSPVTALADAYTVGKGNDFGGLRTWGAVGFALGVFITARIVGMTGPAAIFPVYALCYLTAAAALVAINKKTAGESSGETLPVRADGHCSDNHENSDTEDKPEIAGDREEPQGFRGYPKVLSDRKLRRIIICTFFFGGTNVANNTYFSFLYTDGGGTLAGVGVCMLIMVGSEAPFMALSKRLSDRFTMEKVIMAAMAVSVLRFMLYTMGLPWWMLIVTGFLQGIVNGLLLVEFVRLIAVSAPENIRSLAISAYYVIGSHMSTIVCQVAGGYILEHLGACGVYGFFALFNMTGLILYAAFGLWKHEQKGNNQREKHRRKSS